MDMLVFERHGGPAWERVESRTRRPSPWARLGALCGLVGGCLAAIFGAILLAGAWALGGAVGSILSNLGTAVSFLTVPLLLIGGHCLDLLSKRCRGRQARVELARLSPKDALSQ